MRKILNKRKEDGYLYDYQAYPFLAARIESLFENDNLCEKFSYAAIKKAEKAHDRYKNLDSYLKMYYEIYNS